MYNCNDIVYSVKVFILQTFRISVCHDYAIYTVTDKGYLFPFSESVFAVAIVYVTGNDNGYLLTTYGIVIDTFVRIWQEFYNILHYLIYSGNNACTIIII